MLQHVATNDSEVNELESNENIDYENPNATAKTKNIKEIPK